jgi:hypothetical protein
LGVKRGANNPIPEKITVMKPCRRARPTQVCSARKQEEEEEEG